MAGRRPLVPPRWRHGADQSGRAHGPLCVRHDGPFRCVDDLELATQSWVHWFNTARLHSSIGYQTPVEHEEQYYRENKTRQQLLPGEPILH
jgi:putative transposase